MGRQREMRRSASCHPCHAWGPREPSMSMQPAPLAWRFGLRETHSSPPQPAADVAVRGDHTHDTATIFFGLPSAGPAGRKTAITGAALSGIGRRDDACEGDRGG